MTMDDFGLRILLVVAVTAFFSLMFQAYCGGDDDDYDDPSYP